MMDFFLFYRIMLPKHGGMDVYHGEIKELEFVDKRVYQVPTIWILWNLKSSMIFSLIPIFRSCADKNWVTKRKRLRSNCNRMAENRPVLAIDQCGLKDWRIAEQLTTHLKDSNLIRLYCRMDYPTANLLLSLLTFYLWDQLDVNPNRLGTTAILATQTLDRYKEKTAGSGSRLSISRRSLIMSV